MRVLGRAGETVATGGSRANEIESGSTAIKALLPFPEQVLACCRPNLSIILTVSLSF